MWNVLKPSDLAQAKETLEARRGDLLRRHAEEIENLAAEQADIDTLRRLAAAFCDKFNVAPAPQRPTHATRQGAGPSREPWRVAPRGQPQSNFAVFSGALARAF